MLKTENGVFIRPYKPTDRAALMKLYCQCFAEPPWYEVFSQDEIKEELLQVASWPDAIINVATLGGQVIGGAWSYSCGRRGDIVGIVDAPPDAIYIAEIFVSRLARGRGVAHSLVGRLLKQTASSQGVVRTSVNQPVIIRLFEQLGWRIVAHETVMSRKCIQGVVADVADERVMLTGLIRK